MSTPTKPERVEAGQRREWNPGERAYSRGPFVLVADGSMFHCKYDRGGEGVLWSAAELERMSTLMSPAPATPGTATVTPVATARPLTPEEIARAQDAIKRLNEKSIAWPPLEIPAEFRYGTFSSSPPWYVGIDYGLEVSKPPASPVYGRLVGELRAPDGTPRTALEAIRAKREPEPWVESCDLLHWLRDA